MIRSSLESKIYILQGYCPAYQFRNRGGQPMVAPTEGSQAPKWLGKALLSAATLLILAWLAYRIWRGNFEWRLFVGTLYRVRWSWLMASILLMLLTYLGRAWRWEVMLRPLGRKISILQLTYDTSIGFTAVVLLGRAGEIVRPYLISLSAGVPFSSQVAAWMLERIFDLLAVLLLFGFALIRVPSGLTLGAALEWVVSAGGYLVVAIGALLLVFLILFRNFSEVAERRILSAVTFLPEDYYKRVERMLTAFSQGMESVRNGWSLILLIFYTIVEWLLILSCYYSLFLSFPATASFNITDVVIILGFIAFGSLIQIPGIGGGIQVVSIVVLTQMYHLPMEAASGVAVFIWVVTLITVVPVGLICAFHQGLNWSKLKRLTKEIPL